MTQNQASLKLNIKTWTRDSHGLFDYEANSTKISMLDIQKNCNLIRRKNEVKYIGENDPIEFEERELGKILFKEDRIIISNPINLLMLPSETNINEIQNKIWYVIKHDDNIKENPSSIHSSGMCEVKLNDIIKLGRVKYAITEINLEEKKNINKADTQKPVFELVSEYK